MHVTAEQRERRPMATAFYLEYINLPAGITILSAATHTQSVMHHIGIFVVGEVHGRGDVVPFDVKVVWFRSPWKVGATMSPKGARRPGSNTYRLKKSRIYTGSCYSVSRPLKRVLTIWYRRN